MRAREDWIDAARGVALAAVAFHHVVGYQLASVVSAPAAVLQADLVLDGFRMPTLVAVSGLLSTHVRHWPWRDVWRRRAAPLFLLYAVWAVVGTVVVAALTDPASAASAADRLAWLVLRPDGWTWYLAALALYILAARALRSVPTLVLVPVAAAVFLVAMYSWPDRLTGSLDWWWYVAEHWVFFVCAERGAAGYRRLSSRATSPLASLSLALFVAAGVAAVWAGLAAEPLVLGVLAVLGTWLSICCAGAWGSARWLAWARAIGRRSLGVYAIHGWLAVVVWYAVGGLVRPFPFDGIIAPALFTAGILAAAYGLTVLISRVAPVPLLRPWWDTGARAEREPTPAAIRAQ